MSEDTKDCGRLPVVASLPEYLTDELAAIGQASADRAKEDQRLLSQLREELAQRDAEVERLRRFEASYIEWQEKTEWVQADAKPKELGKHRADVLRERIAALSVNHRKSGFCGDPYVHDCGRNDCPLSDSYAGHSNKVAGEKGNAN